MSDDVETLDAPRWQAHDTARVSASSATSSSLSPQTLSQRMPSTVPRIHRARSPPPPPAPTVETRHPSAPSHQASKSTRGGAEQKGNQKLPQQKLLTEAVRRDEERKRVDAEAAACDRLLSGVRAEASLHASAPSGQPLVGTPYVTLTYAQALDGSIAGPLGAHGPRLMLSGEKSMTLTHGLRAAHEAILVGVGTVLADNPQLTVRLVEGESPMRVILDSTLRVPLDARALQPTPIVAPAAAAQSSRPHAVVVTLEGALHDTSSAAKLTALRRLGVFVLGVPADGGGRVCLQTALRHLQSQLGVRSLMIEGGAQMIASCAHAGLAHRVIVTLAPQTLVNGLRPGGLVSPGAHTTAAAAAADLRRVEAFCLGDDVVVSGEGPAARPQLASRL